MAKKIGFMSIILCSVIGQLIWLTGSDFVKAETLMKEVEQGMASLAPLELRPYKKSGKWYDVKLMRDHITKDP